MLTQQRKFQGNGEKLISLNTSNQIPIKLHNYISLRTPSSGSLSPLKNFDSFNLRITFPFLCQFYYLYQRLCWILPEARLNITIKCVLPPATYVYMRKIVESVFPTLLITFLLTFFFLSLQTGLTHKISFTIFSQTKQCFCNKKYISSTFETVNMPTALALCFHILNTKKRYCLYNNDITCIQKFPYGIYAEAVVKTHNVVCRDICNLWVHIKCNNTTKFYHRKLQQSREPW